PATDGIRPTACSAGRAGAGARMPWRLTRSTVSTACFPTTPCCRPCSGGTCSARPRGYPRWRTRCGSAPPGSETGSAGPVGQLRAVQEAVAVAVHAVELARKGRVGLRLGAADGTVTVTVHAIEVDLVIAHDGIGRVLGEPDLAPVFVVQHVAGGVTGLRGRRCRRRLRGGVRGRRRPRIGGFHRIPGRR